MPYEELERAWDAYVSYAERRAEAERAAVESARRGGK